MSNGDTFDEINGLLLSYQDGSIADADLAKFREMLKSSPDARRHFAAIQALETALHLEHLAGGAARFGHSASVAAPARRARWTPLAVAAAVLFTAGIAMLWHFTNQRTNVSTIAGNAQGLPGPENEAKDDGVATFTHSLEAEWAGEKAPVLGSSLAPGKYELRKGVAQFEFHSSARMSVKGPALVEIVSAFSVTLHTGILRAHAPEQARGFTVSTTQVKVVDRGTDFTVEASPGNSRVQVMEGEVELSSVSGSAKNGIARRLAAGNAMAVDRAGTFSRVEAEAPALDSFADIQRQTNAKSGMQFGAWQKRRTEMHSGPNIAAYYDFQKRPGAESILHGHLDSTSSTDGAIVGCAWSSGRWPGKDALDFKRPGDRVRVNIPGAFDAMTLAAWVRVDALDNRLQGLLLTDRYEIGNPHWQITSTGSLRLGIRLPDRNGRLEASGYGSPPVFLAKQIGVWTFVSTVYDRSNKRVQHYIDGRRVSEHELVFDQALRIGPADIGNWGVPLDAGQQPIRNFNGRIDEMMVWKVALTPEQILEYYQAGRP